jgi:hypothetical protein
MTSWRNVPLTTNASYRLEADIVSVHDSLRAGQVVAFISADYSHYDNLTALTFRERSSGRLLQLWWFDNDPDIDWRKLTPVIF